MDWRRPQFCRVGSVAFLLATTSVFGLLPAETAYASAACDALNSRTDSLPNNVNVTISGFEAGDVVTVTMTNPRTTSARMIASFANDALSGFIPVIPFQFVSGGNSVTSAPSTFQAGFLNLLVRGAKGGPGIDYLASYNCISITPSGSSDSGKLESQQTAFSVLAMTNDLENLGGVLDGLDGDPDGNNGVQISRNGFSASTTGVAKWIDRRRKQKIGRQLASLPKDENGNDVHVAPAAYFSPDSSRPLWNAWIRGSWTHYDGDGTSFDGLAIGVLAGVDYQISPLYIMGLLAGYGNTDFDTVTGGTRGAFETDGYTVGPYGSVKLSEHLQFDGMVAYTYSDYDNRVGVTTGDFKAHRVTVGAQLKGRWVRGAYFVEPSLRFMYADEQQNSYTDSTGKRLPGRTVNAGRLSVGPKLGYIHKAANGDVLKPWASVRGAYDFSNQGNVPSSGLPDLNDLLSARVSIGMDATTSEGLSVTIRGDISGLGSGQYTAYGGTAKINVPF